MVSRFILRLFSGRGRFARTIACIGATALLLLPPARARADYDQASAPTSDSDVASDDGEIDSSSDPEVVVAVTPEDLEDAALWIVASVAFAGGAVLGGIIGRAAFDG